MNDLDLAMDRCLGELEEAFENRLEEDGIDAKNKVLRIDHHRFWSNIQGGSSDHDYSTGGPNHGSPSADGQQSNLRVSSGNLP